ncbi:MAG: hypothetical protein E7429_03150 [Ruminococcaceae bacterium]|nr:hypothetical protein [Oscillospiraceae bacterium]
MKRFRIIPLLLTLVLLFTVSPSVLAEPLLIAPAPQQTGWLVPKVKVYDGRFTDAAGAWCKDAIETVYETGLMEGKTADRFDYTSSLTRAEITVITARLLHLLTGGDGNFPAPAEGEVWYQPHYDYLSEHLGEPPFGPEFGTGGAFAWTADSPCQRGYFARLLCAVLEAAEISLPVLNDITSPPDVRNADIFSLYQIGILNGTDAFGTFNSGGELTRGAAAAMLARLVSPAQRRIFTPTTFDQCRDILGLEPETVVVTTGDASITAEQVSNHLCRNLRKQYHQLILSGPNACNPNAALADTLTAVKMDLALEQLAEEKGITVTDGELTLFPIGYLCMTAEGLRWEAYHALLEQKLLDLYEETFGAQSTGISPHAMKYTQGRVALEDDLRQTADQITLALAPELTALDLSAALERLIAGPSYIGLD